MNILEMLKTSEKTALIQGGTRVTYSQLLDMGLGFGGALRRAGIGKGQHVLVFLPLSIQLYKAMIGAWSIGAIPIFIDYSRGAKFVDESIKRLAPDIIVHDGVTGIIRLGYPKMRKIKALHIKRTGEAVDVQRLDSDHPAILTFTSGSTGLPKIASRSHGFLINQYNVLRQHMDFSEKHIDLGTLPVFTLANLAAHMTTLLPDKSYRFKINAKKLAAQMERENVSRIICSPALIAKLLAHSQLPALKSAYLGGAPVYPSVLQKVGGHVDLHIVYGSTEAEPISGIRWADVTEADRQRIAQGGGLPVGKVVPQVECEIEPDGEIIVSGDTVLKGYLGGIGDNDNKLHRDGKIWHKTGDAGYFDDEGRLWLLGRVSQAIHDEHGTLYPFCAECILDVNLGARGAIVVRNGRRAIVVEGTAARTADLLELLKPLHIAEVITVKKIPMDKRHDAKIDYGRLHEMIL